MTDHKKGYFRGDGNGNDGSRPSRTDNQNTGDGEHR